MTFVPPDEKRIPFWQWLLRWLGLWAFSALLGFVLYRFLLQRPPSTGWESLIISGFTMATFYVSIAFYEHRRQHRFRPTTHGAETPVTEVRHLDTGVSLFQVDGETLARADLDGAQLHKANLIGADLHGASLQDADISEAYLQGANLEGADLGGANLVGAHLNGANLRGADLCGADFGGQGWNRTLHDGLLKNTELTDALYDANTRWPCFFEPEKRGCRKLHQPRFAAPREETRLPPPG